MINELIKNRKITKYRLSQTSGIPYPTLRDICYGKTEISKCTAETVFRLSKSLGVTMEDLVADSLEVRLNFDVFRSNICHKVKEIGELDFIISTLQNNDIGRYRDKKWYAEMFYMLAMVDYLCRRNNIQICTKYDDIRGDSLEKPLYPADVTLAARLFPDKDIMKQVIDDAIPEFRRFNIIEGDIDNVC